MLPSMQIPRFGGEHGSYSFMIATRLRSPAARVWEHASTFAGVNRDLWPLARMTFLPALEQLTPGPVRTAMNDRRVAYDAQRRGGSASRSRRRR
jgi:hypothetical protein